MIVKVLLLAHASGNSDAYYKNVWKPTVKSEEMLPEETAKERI